MSILLTLNDGAGATAMNFGEEAEVAFLLMRDAVVAVVVAASATSASTVDPLSRLGGVADSSPIQEETAWCHHHWWWW
ncbi:hypothetical protein ON010_g1270 [Phytophthora cinnamomi]|nr:hypothetical protein ON010_g1270 [Phytophthora cinnamomi]